MPVARQPNFRKLSVGRPFCLRAGRRRAGIDRRVPETSANGKGESQGHFFEGHEGHQDAGRSVRPHPPRHASRRKADPRRTSRHDCEGDRPDAQAGPSEASRGDKGPHRPPRRCLPQARRIGEGVRLPGRRRHPRGSRRGRRRNRRQEGARHGPDRCRPGGGTLRDDPLRHAGGVGEAARPHRLRGGAEAEPRRAEGDRQEADGVRRERGQPGYRRAVGSPAPVGNVALPWCRRSRPRRSRTARPFTRCRSGRPRRRPARRRARPGRWRAGTASPCSGSG